MEKHINKVRQSVYVCICISLNPFWRICSLVLVYAPHSTMFYHNIWNSEQNLQTSCLRGTPSLSKLRLPTISQSPKYAISGQNIVCLLCINRGVHHHLMPIWIETWGHNGWSFLIPRDEKVPTLSDHLGTTAKKKVKNSWLFLPCFNVFSGTSAQKQPVLHLFRSFPGPCESSGAHGSHWSPREKKQGSVGWTWISTARQWEFLWSPGGSDHQKVTPGSLCENPGDHWYHLRASNKIRFRGLQLPLK